MEGAEPFTRLDFPAADQIRPDVCRAQVLMLSMLFVA